MIGQKNWSLTYKIHALCFRCDTVHREQLPCTGATLKVQSCCWKVRPRRDDRHQQDEANQPGVHPSKTESWTEKEKLSWFVHQARAVKVRLGKHGSLVRMPSFSLLRFRAMAMIFWDSKVALAVYWHSSSESFSKVVTVSELSIRPFQVGAIYEEASTLLQIAFRWSSGGSWSRSTVWSAHRTCRSQCLYGPISRNIRRHVGFWMAEIVILKNRRDVANGKHVAYSGTLRANIWEPESKLNRPSLWQG